MPVDTYYTQRVKREGLVYLTLLSTAMKKPHPLFTLQVLLLFPCLMVVISLALVFLPFWQNPYPQLMGFGISAISVPLYIFFIMKIPCRLRPSLVDRFDKWLVAITSKVFNSQVHSKI